MTSNASESQSCSDTHPQLHHSLEHSHSEDDDDQDDETNTQVTNSDLDAFRHSTNSPTPASASSINEDQYSMNPTQETSSLYSHSTLPTHAISHYNDCTTTVHQMHNLLLYLLTNPSEFTEAIAFYHAQSTTSTLTAFHAEYDFGTDVGSLFHTTANGGEGEQEQVPIPFLVFCSDAEVVLPQAHTASQLFGYERDGGIELEAASGILGLCQLFLRWLALMPGGDHMNLISPPGLTVMRIAGGRYRVTAAHRVVWTWNNEFLPDPTASQTSWNADELHVGDLVTMTIVDVFETDADGKLLSYCPTFDNRAIFKTTHKVEQIRKSSSKLVQNVNSMKQSKTAVRVNQAASLLGKLGMKAAGTVKDVVEKKMEEKRRYQEQDPSSLQNSKKQSSGNQSPNDVKDVQGFERALNHAAVAGDAKRGEHYISDDETTSYGDK